MADLTIRDLRGDDIFPMLGILNKLDLADTLVAEFANGEKAPAPAPGATEEEATASLAAFKRSRGVRIGGTIAKTLLANIGTVRDDVNRLLGDLTDTDEATIKSLGFAEYLRLLTALGKRPEFIEVFTSAAALGSAGGDAS